MRCSFDVPKVRRSVLAAFGWAAVSCAAVSAACIWFAGHRAWARSADGEPEAMAMPPIAAELKPRDDEGDIEETAGQPGAPALSVSELSSGELRALVFAAPEALGSIVVGRPNRGALLNPAQMPEGRYWRVLEPERAYGTRETIDALIRAIDEVESRFTDSPPLSIGHISAASGGYLRPHRSHQTGRDVDLGYYYTDGSTWYARATEANLDRARTWVLVRAMLPDVEFIFMDRTVQELLRSYAETIGEDPTWLDSIFEYPERTRETVVRHTWGHLTHLHARFKSPIAESTGQLAYAPLVERRLVSAVVPSKKAKRKRRR